MEDEGHRSAFDAPLPRLAHVELPARVAQHRHAAHLEIPRVGSEVGQQRHASLGRQLEVVDGKGIVAAHHAGGAHLHLASPAMGQARRGMRERGGSQPVVEHAWATDAFERSEKSPGAVDGGRHVLDVLGLVSHLGLGLTVNVEAEKDSDRSHADARGKQGLHQAKPSHVGVKG
jgi:hypothetical protein